MEVGRFDGQWLAKQAAQPAKAALLARLRSVADHLAAGQPPAAQLFPHYRVKGPERLVGQQERHALLLFCASQPSQLSPFGKTLRRGLLPGSAGSNIRKTLSEAGTAPGAGRMRGRSWGIAKGVAHLLNSFVIEPAL